jgi:hypothetical protein
MRDPISLLRVVLVDPLSQATLICLLLVINGAWLCQGSTWRGGVDEGTVLMQTRPNTWLDPTDIIG